MCDYGRLNYKWIQREDRLTTVMVGKQESNWGAAIVEISRKLSEAAVGTVAIVASARLANEELYLLSKLAKKLGAITDSVPRSGPSDKLLLNSDRNPNTNGAKLTGLAANPIGSALPKIADAIKAGKIQ